MDDRIFYVQSEEKVSQ